MRRLPNQQPQLVGTDTRRSALAPLTALALERGWRGHARCSGVVPSARRIGGPEEIGVESSA